ncbi:MAG: hypothetical protein LDL41_02615 [Coleofasciculus sp. S288]|nr:hypothetical protein [Coleofasciculus sp. S288]
MGSNFSDTVLAEENVPNVPAPGIWHDWLSNCDVEAEENEMVIDLPEYEARVLVFRE